MIYTVLYFTIFIVTSFVTIADGKPVRILESYLYVIISSVIFFMSAVRHNVGYDFSSYKNIFNTIHNSSKSIWYFYQKLDMDIGFVLLNKLSASYPMLIFIVASLAIIPKLIFLYKESESKLFVLLMYYCGIFITYDMGVIRQGLSITIFLFGLKYIREQKLFEYLLIIFLSFIFHPSALVYIPLYFIGNIELSKKTYYITALTALIFSLFSESSIFLSLAKYLPEGIISTKLAYYTLYTSENLTLSLLKRIIFLVIFVEYFKRSKLLTTDKKQLIYLNGYYLSILFASIFASVPIIGGRGNAGLYFLQVFIFSKMVKNTQNKILKLVIIVVISAMFYKTLLGPVNDIYSFYLPYQTIFN